MTFDTNPAMTSDTNPFHDTNPVMTSVDGDPNTTTDSNHAMTSDSNMPCHHEQPHQTHTAPELVIFLQATAKSLKNSC